MEIILKYFPNLNDIQIEQFSKLGSLYKEWNSKINVISRKDIDNIYQNHILHSLAISKIIKFNHGTEILDIGTGGGFPGIPLAIMFPNANFYLVDSIGKKIKVVEGITNSLNLQNVKFEQIRAENINKEFDFVVSRAVTQLPEFLKWVEGKITQINCNTINNGVIYLKGGDLSEETKEIKKPLRIYDLERWFDEDFFVEKKIVYIDFFKKKIKKNKKR